MSEAAFEIVVAAEIEVVKANPSVESDVIEKE